MLGLSWTKSYGGGDTPVSYTVRPVDAQAAAASFGNSVARIGDVDDISLRITNPQSAVIGAA